MPEHPNARGRTAARLAALLVVTLVCGCGGGNALPPGTAKSGSLTGQLTTSPTPARVGLDTIFVVTLSDGGAPVTGANVNIALFFRGLNQTGPTSPCSPTAPGRYETPGLVTGMAGKWEAEVTVSRPNHPDARLTLSFNVAR